MNVLYTIRHKGKIALLLLAIIFAEIYFSYAYSSNISQIGESFSEVYADRIIAQDYIYKMSNILSKRKKIVFKNPTTDNLKKDLIFDDYGLKISWILANYEKTKLTTNEKLLFDKFKINVFSMIALEKKYASESNHLVSNEFYRVRNNLLKESITQLDKLSEIQIVRVKDLNETSQKTVSFSSLLNQFDWALLLVILVSIQILIFTSKSSRPKLPQNQYLN